MSNFEKELTRLLNAHSRENGSDTPDFLLASFLLGCLEAFDQTVRRRSVWYTIPAKAVDSPEALEEFIDSIAEEVEISKPGLYYDFTDHRWNCSDCSAKFAAARMFKHDPNCIQGRLERFVKDYRKNRKETV